MDGDAGDKYTGLDRFGRVVDQRWLTASDHTDRFQYTYDRNSNPISKNIVDMGTTADNFDQTFTYDSLNQLATYERADGFDQDWSFDGQGNWLSFNNDGTTQTRTSNQQNEITSISGATTPAYDANGNMTTGETGKTYEYDAWNRLVRVKESGDTIVAFEYDALNRRIEQTDSETRDFFFSSAWQVLEERIDGSADVQFVWSPVYVDAMIARDWDSDANGSLETRHYIQQDANWNVTAITDEAGAVVERYVYTPFGEQTILTETWASRSASLDFWVHGFQGKRFESLIGFHDFNNRWYSPSLGRFATMDPIGFAGGQTNLYGFVDNGPVGALDPSGLEALPLGGPKIYPPTPYTDQVQDRLGASDPQVHQWLAQSGGWLYDMNLACLKTRHTGTIHMIGPSL